ncbi:MAG TPA: FkbM family methyltransferase, partial [Reyranella sp.]|nr:FkbM family methyltransferase [Reyranella sp.]
TGHEWFAPPMGHTPRISGPAEIIMLKIVKDSVLRVSRSFGYDIVPLREMKERDFALHLRELLAHLDIDCVLDVGANAGQYRDFLRDKVLYDGPIISFEPVSRHIDALRERSRGDRDWHIEGYALGSSDGSMPINVMVSDQFSSFLEPDHGRVKDYAGLNVPCHTETVTVRTLDVVLPVLQERIGFDRPYLKIDTQGFDIEVLRGAADSLPAVKALQTEASVIGIYKGMPQYMDIIRYLDQRGFDITGLYPVSRDSALRLVEFDCVMINRAVAGVAA